MAHFTPIFSLPVNSIPKVSLMFRRKDSKILFSSCLGRVKDVFMVVCTRMKNLSSSGLLTLGKSGRITISTPDDAGLKAKENESNYLYYLSKFLFFYRNIKRVVKKAFVTCTLPEIFVNFEKY